MATITAELLPDSAAIRLSVWSLAGIQSLTRRDANGINDVRTLPGVIGPAPVQVEDLRNLVQNTTTGTNYNSARSTNTGGVGSSYTRFTADGTGATYIYYNGFLGGTGAGTGMMPVVPGDKVSANVDLRNSNAFTIQARLNWSYYDAAGASVAGAISGNMQTLTAGGYAYPYLSHTVPAGAAYARVLIFWYTATGVSPLAGTTIDFKYLAAFKGPNSWDNEQVFFHGGSADTDEYRYEFTGTGYASESVRYRQESAIIFTDYEAGSGPVSYDLVNNAGELVTLDVAGFVLDAPWLFTPLIPGYSRKAVSVTGIDTEFEDMSTIHSGLLGRSDPIVVLRPLGLRSGTMEIYAGTYADALEILSPLQRATVMMLRQPEHAGLDMYFAPAGGSPKIVSLVTNAGATVWGVQVPYIEVKRPEGPIAGALGWTYADLAAAVPRYSDLRRTFATYADMRLNKRITT
ncbi:minor tail protein [Arthrobacter phage Yavru]|uniref:Minor tail protein n=1 Tax=Arthrobacter phage Yavru TaxID=2776857 RepID=A0A7M1CIR3_9CAUD|nr:minor tail protein [Arthrobacter phage Yavru]QOP64222.1 minor tail protein [Arthrobacter phage Yavru]